MTRPCVRCFYSSHMGVLPAISEWEALDAMQCGIQRVVGHKDQRVAALTQQLGGRFVCVSDAYVDDRATQLLGSSVGLIPRNFYKGLDTV